MTLVAADVLRTGGTARVLGFTAKASSTIGTFLRSFTWAYSANWTGSALYNQAA